MPILVFTFKVLLGTVFIECYPYPKHPRKHLHKDVPSPVVLSNTEWTPLTVKVVNDHNKPQQKNFIDDMVFEKEIFSAPQSRVS